MSIYLDFVKSKKLVTLFLLASFLVLVMTVLFSGKASATISFNPDRTPYMWAPFYDTFRECDTGPGAQAGFAAGSQSWLSTQEYLGGIPYSRNNVSRYRVDEIPAAGIPLWINMGSVTCLDANGLNPPQGSQNLYVTRFAHYYSTTQAGVSLNSGNTLLNDLSWGAGAKGTLDYRQLPFTYHPGPLPVGIHHRALNFDYRSVQEVRNRVTGVTEAACERYDSTPANPIVITFAWGNTSQLATCKVFSMTLNLTIEVTPVPTSTIRGRVFNANDMGQNYAGVVIDTCLGNTVTTGADGYFSFNVQVGQGFCVRATNGYPANQIGGPHTRPWNEGYYGCPGYGGSAANPNYCGHATYECQVAGGVYAGCGLGGIDRSWDEGFDIVFEISSPPSVFNIDATCSALNFAVASANSQSVTITLVVDGVAQTGSSYVRNNQPTSPSGVNHSFDISAWRDFSGHNFSVQVTNGVSTINSATDNSGSCLSITCSVVASRSPIEAGSSFDLTPTFTFSGSIGSRGNSYSGINVNIVLPAGFTGPSNPAFSNLSVGPGATSIAPGAKTGYTASSVTSQYTIGSTLSGGLTFTAPGGNCGTVPVGTMPYLREYGGDVWAGGVFANPDGTPAGTPTSGSIYAFNDNVTTDGDPADWAGAGAQLTVTSLLNINQYVSAGTRTGTCNTSFTACAPKGLSFANTGSTVYGGSFGYNRTIYNYYSGTRDAEIHIGDWNGMRNTVGGNGATAIRAATRGQYTLNGQNVASPGTGQEIVIPTGIQAAVYASGNVYIRNNIILADVSGAVDPDTLPYFALIVCGNIYIDQTVTRLDGLFVAQPGTLSGGQCVPAGGTSGTIYTCATSGTQACSVSNLSTAGNRQLAVNGSLVASRIKWLRTYCSLRFATFGEGINFGTGAGNTSCTNSGNSRAAEIVNYTPHMWLAPSPLKTPNLSEDGTLYNAIRGLPPIFNTGSSPSGGGSLSCASGYTEYNGFCYKEIPGFIGSSNCLRANPRFVWRPIGLPVACYDKIGIGESSAGGEYEPPNNGGGVITPTPLPVPPRQPPPTTQPNNPL